ncbi:MAG: hypothetical protein EBS86_12005, partial [Crocinitomicaceae bacterium]|nr:hypothetical protein [Crocinitomicaceae bacterium]
MSSNDLKLAKINELKTQIELLEKQLCKKLTFTVRNRCNCDINFNGQLVKKAFAILETFTFDEDKKSKEFNIMLPIKKYVNKVCVQLFDYMFNEEYTNFELSI